MVPPGMIKPPPEAPVPWWQRLHQRLMPDYNRRAAAYWWAVVLTGAVVIAHALVVVSHEPPALLLQMLVGAAIAMLAGLFPVRIPGSKNSFAASEIFLFLMLLLMGPAPAALAAACETALSSWRTSKRWTSRIVSPAIAAVVMFGTGSLLHAMLGQLQQHQWTNEGLLIVATMLFSLAYFVASTLMVSAVPRLKRGESVQLADLIGVFGWVGIAYAGSSAVASLLFLSYRSSGLGVLMAIVPLLAMLLATLHYFFRQQEANEAVRLSAAEAAEREAELAAQHVRALESSERRFHSAFTHASIGMALVSFEGDIRQTNTALSELLGRPGADLITRNLRDIVSADDLSALSERLHQLQSGTVEDIAVELRWLHVSGTELWVAAHGSLFSEPGSATPSLILQAHDVTARRQAEASLHHIAFHDSLTGLPNRRRFHELLAQAVERSHVQPGASFAVMFLDFDRFKLINDSLGHSAGDDFLVQVSQRIARQLRPMDVVARLGGDEFAVLALDLDHDDEAIRLAERLQVVLRATMDVQGNEWTTSASIGITCSSIGARSPEEVLRDADIAMYTAKAAGKARHAVFDVSLHAQASRRMQLERELRRAISEGALSVAYQPMFRLDGGALVGFEALARWTHPELGVIGPDVFIPIAEETGLVVALTDLVLERACAQLQRCQARDPQFAELAMQVNVSGRDLAHAGLVGRVRQALARAGIAPRHLTLELTENILMAKIESALPLLSELRTLGVHLSVDDFGTGYSSLAHLSSLPIHSLKIDRSFVHDLQGDVRKAAVVQAVITLGHALGKTVVAEGIESASQLAQLRALGCELGQGYHLSRPLSGPALELWLETTWPSAHKVVSAAPDRAPRQAALQAALH